MIEDEWSPFAPPARPERHPRLAWEESPFAAAESGDQAEDEAWDGELEDEEEDEEYEEERLEGGEVERGEFEESEVEADELEDERVLEPEEFVPDQPEEVLSAETEFEDLEDPSYEEEDELDRDLERVPEWEQEAYEQESAAPTGVESYAPESLADERSLAEELGMYDFEAAPGIDNRIVKSAVVSCANRDRKLPIFRAMGTDDPVGVLEAVCQRAVTMLDNTIAELNRIRARVRAGEPAAFPLINDLLARSLENRMLMRVKEPAAWTGKGPRTAEQIVRWLRNIRKTITGGYLRFTCLAATNCNPTTWAWVFPSRYRVFLCRRFWNPKPGVDAATHLEYQAQTIIHEVSHIYYVTEDKGRGPGHAECISQFVAEANGSPIDPDFSHFCGTAGPVRP